MGFINEALRVANDINAKETDIETNMKFGPIKLFDLNVIKRRRDKLIRIINSLPNDRLTMDLLKEYLDNLSYLDKTKLADNGFVTQLLHDNHNVNSATFCYDLMSNYIFTLTVNFLREGKEKTNLVKVTVSGPNSTGCSWTDYSLEELNVHDKEINMDTFGKNLHTNQLQVYKVFIEETMKHIKEYLIERVSERVYK